MAAESPRRPRSRSPRWVVPALLLGVGTWVIARRRRTAEPVDVWAPPAEVWAPPAAAPAPHTAPPPAPPADDPAPVRPLLAAPAPAAAAGGPAPVPTAPVPTAPVATAATPYGPGSATPLPDGSAPGPEYTIKGNASSRLFHPPSSPYYGRTRAEVWFRTDDDAVAAGFSPYRSRRR